MRIYGRLVGLTLAHLTAGLVITVSASYLLRTSTPQNDWPLVPFFASTFCQAILVAFWGAFSSTSPWWRLIGLVVVAGYLEWILPLNLRPEFRGMASIVIAVTTACLFGSRALGLQFERRSDAEWAGPGEDEGWRVSIRALMLLTFAVAALSAAARSLRPSPSPVLMRVWALCSVAVGLTSLWVALGRARPVRRAAVVFLLSPLLGAFVCFSASARPGVWIVIILIMTLYPAALLASLCVVRSCGYRLVGRDA